MPLIATEGDSRPKQLAPAGTHVARCIQVIDLGTQVGEWMGKPKIQHKVRLTWELPDELAVFNEADGSQPFLLSKKYTLSLNDKAALRHDLESWRGKQFTPEELKGFDLANILGQPCLLTAVHNTKGDRTYVDITTVSKLAKGMTCPAAINPLVHYEITMGRNQVFQDLPEWMRQIIEGCEEWKQQAEPEADERPGAEEEEGEDGGKLPF